MKRIGKSAFIMLLCLVAAAVVLPIRANAVDVAINETNFPDETFRSYVSTNFDTDGNGVLSDAEKQNVSKIDVQNKNISSLVGVQYFNVLKILNCPSNHLTWLDLRLNTALTSVNCAYNQLTSLYLSGNKALEYLACNQNQLTALDVSGCTGLTDLTCGQNQLKSLDLSKNTNLTYIDCTANVLTSLILPNYKGDYEVTIHCEGNYLTSLDLSKCTGYTSLYCNNNYLKSLDLSKCTAVGTLYCMNNKLTSLKVPKRCSIIYCWDNPLTTISDLSQSSLRELQCYDCQLTTLDVSGCTSLDYLESDGNPMTTLNASGCTALTMLACFSSGNLKSLNVSGCTALTSLVCNYNNLTSLNMSECKALTSLYCNDNNLKTLDLTGCTALRLLYCSSNNLTQLDLSMCPSLETLDCSYNNLAALDITDSPALSRLMCTGNPIGILDLRWNITFKNLVMAGEKTYKYTTYGVPFVTYGKLTAPPTTRLRTNMYYEPPVIIMQPETVFTIEGETVTFSFTAATPRDTTLQYQWYCNNEAIDGENGPTLEVTAETGLSGNKYFCEVKNQGGVVCTKMVSLRFVTTPKITTQPKSATVKAGKTATFKIKASGEGLKYQWYYMKPKTTKWVKISSATKATYSFTAKKAKNGYKYRCVVSNAAGKVTSKAVKLTVK